MQKHFERKTREGEEMRFVEFPFLYLKVRYAGSIDQAPNFTSHTRQKIMVSQLLAASRTVLF